MAAMPDRYRRKTSPVVDRCARRLSQAACADHPVPRLLVGPAARFVGLDLADLDAGVRRQSRHHRPVRAGRHALYDQISLGAADRRARRAVAVAAFRPPPRLALAVAILAHRGDRFSRLLRSVGCRHSSSPSARFLSPPLRQPRTSSSTRSGSRAWTRASRRPAWRPMSPPTASACWSRPPARCSWSADSRATASTITPRGAPDTW